MNLLHESGPQVLLSSRCRHSGSAQRRTERLTSSVARAAAGGALALAVLFASRHAHAGGPIGGNGQPITTSEYSLDLYQGPLFAGSRVTGLGGAYVAIA